jgi:uncharacterized damage-inducible protein DinB
MITDALLPEFDHEMGTTRRVLDRVPEADFAWQPHDKSMSLGELAAHLANIPTWCGSILDMMVFDILTLGDRAKPPASRRALLADFDAKVVAARSSLAAKTDPELLAPWTLKSGTHEVFTMPRISVIRSFVMNHSIHHRGQLSVYLRMRNVPLPAMYGPTADES